MTAEKCFTSNKEEANEGFYKSGTIIYVEEEAFAGALEKIADVLKKVIDEDLIFCISDRAVG